jgi:hypothetical protein
MSRSPASSVGRSAQGLRDTLLLLAGTVAIERAVAAADPAWIYPVMWLTVSLA